MEQPPKQELTIEQIDSKIAELSKKKIRLDGELGRTHFESGNDSLDDQAQEQFMDDQLNAMKIAEINHIQDEINALSEQRASLKDSLQKDA